MPPFFISSNYIVYIFFLTFLSQGQLVTGTSKAWLGGFGEIGKPYSYTHPSTKQCNYAYTHPSTKQCDAAAGSHTHTKAQITDFPTTMTPTAHTHAASDVTSGTLSADRIPGLAASKITSGTLSVARGGTGVTANPSMLVNLGSTSAASVFAASPRPGVTGTLPVARGGTGVTSLDALKTAIGIASAPMLVDIKSVQYIGGSSSKGLTITVTACDYVVLYRRVTARDSFYTGDTVNTYLFDVGNENAHVYTCTVYKGCNAYYIYDSDSYYTVSFSSDGTTLTFNEDAQHAYYDIYCYTGGNICGTAALYLKANASYSVPACKRLSLFTVYKDTAEVGYSVSNTADVISGGSSVYVSHYIPNSSDYREHVTLNSAGTALTYDYTDGNRIYRNAVCYSTTVI